MPPPLRSVWRSRPPLPPKPVIAAARLQRGAGGAAGGDALAHLLYDGSDVVVHCWRLTGAGGSGGAGPELGEPFQVHLREALAATAAASVGD